MGRECERHATSWRNICEGFYFHFLYTCMLVSSDNDTTTVPWRSRFPWRLPQASFRHSVFDDYFPFFFDKKSFYFRVEVGEVLLLQLGNVKFLYHSLLIIIHITISFGELSAPKLAKYSSTARIGYFPRSFFRCRNAIGWCHFTLYISKHEYYLPEVLGTFGGLLQSSRDSHIVFITYRPCVSISLHHVTLYLQSVHVLLLRIMINYIRPIRMFLFPSFRQLTYYRVCSCHTILLGCRLVDTVLRLL